METARIKMYNTEAFVVVGNIGAGKSTFLDNLKESEPDRQYVKEPIHLFNKSEFSDVAPLSLHYTNPQLYAFGTQIHIIDTLDDYYYNLFSNSGVKHTKPILIESGYIAVKYFSYSFLRKGYLQQHEYQCILNKLLRSEAKLRSYNIKVKGILYLNTNPKQCHQWIKQRGRLEETSFKHMSQYLDALHTAIQEIINEYKEQKNIPVFHLGLTSRSIEDFRACEIACTQ